MRMVNPKPKKNADEERKKGSTVIFSKLNGDLNNRTKTEQLLQDFVELTLLIRRRRQQDTLKTFQENI